MSSKSEQSGKVEQQSEIGFDTTYTLKQGQLFGKYTIVRPLGSGAMGAVYLAKDTKLKRDVALKVPSVDAYKDKDAFVRFEREAQIAAALRHPNLCTVYDCGDVDGQPFICMEYIEGVTLSRVIKLQKRIPQDEIVKLVTRIADGLDQAHQSGILHRDLKPGNILVDSRNEPIIMDFGLSKLLEGRVEDLNLTRPGALLGTPMYMSPEQILGEGDRLGPTSDIFSLGIILYEMCAGELPFKGRSIYALQTEIVKSDPVPPIELRSDLDPRINALCLHMLEKEQNKRPSSMAEVAEKLAQVQAADSSSNAIETVNVSDPIQVDTVSLPISRQPSSIATSHVDEVYGAPSRFKWQAGLVIVAAVLFVVLVSSFWLNESLKQPTDDNQLAGDSRSSAQNGKETKSANAASRIRFRKNLSFIGDEFFEIDFMPVQQQLAVSNATGVEIFDIATGDKKVSLNASGTDNVEFGLVRVSPSGRWVVQTEYPRTVRIWQKIGKNGGVAYGSVRLLEIDDPTDQSVQDVQFFQNDRYLVLLNHSPQNGGSLTVYDLFASQDDDSNIPSKFSKTTNRTPNAAASSNYRHMAVTYDDKFLLVTSGDEIQKWSLPDLRLVDWVTEVFPVLVVASPVSEDFVVRIRPKLGDSNINLRRGRYTQLSELRPVDGEDFYVTGRMAISANGRYVVASGRSVTDLFRVWDLETGQQAEQYAEDRIDSTFLLSDVHIAPDGKSMIFCGPVSGAREQMLYYHYDLPGRMFE